MARVKEFSESEAWARFFLSNRKLENLIRVSVKNDDGAVMFCAAIVKLDNENMLYVETSESGDYVETVETDDALEAFDACATLLDERAAITGEWADTVLEAIVHVQTAGDTLEEQTAHEQGEEMRLRAALGDRFVNRLWEARSEG